MNTKALFWISLAVTGGLGWFLIQNSLDLLNSGFTMQNILSGELPEDYTTSDGSTFYGLTLVLSIAKWFLPLLWITMLGIFIWNKEKSKT